jgi:hypothetical protein
MDLFPGPPAWAGTTDCLQRAGPGGSFFKYNTNHGGTQGIFGPKTQGFSRQALAGFTDKAQKYGFLFSISGPRDGACPQNGNILNGPLKYGN